MQRAIRLQAAGLVDAEQIVSHRFALDDIQQAVEAMGQPERNKIIIHP
jgi:threonine dehydrogenase-like Zn-dependent dehydrogenase